MLDSLDSLSSPDEKKSIASVNERKVSSSRVVKSIRNSSVQLSTVDYKHLFLSKSCELPLDGSLDVEVEIEEEGRVEI